MIKSFFFFLKSRLAVNSVTAGDYNRPLKISKFVKELYTGFQLLNLKNDSLRKRFDAIKVCLINPIFIYIYLFLIFCYLSNVNYS
jgi:hypothetical protein